MTICAIHQPNFMPWLPYFDKIRRSDVFVFLDDVDYPKSGNSMGTWCNRVKIDMHGVGLWFQCPVKREPGTQAIKSVEIRDEKSLFDTWEKTLSHAYKKHKNYDVVMDILKKICNKEHVFLSRLNTAFIKEICNALNIKTNFVYSSDLNCQDKSNQLLSQICKSVEATTYLSGVGSKDYMDLVVFDRENIQVVYQDYITQKGEDFLPFSVLHHLFKTDKSLWDQF